MDNQPIQSSSPIPSSSNSSKTLLPIVKTGFFDFRNKKAYKFFGEKLLDFLVGLFGLFIYNILTGLFIFYGFPFSWIVREIMTIIVIIYLWRRRKYIAIGIITFVIMNILYYISYRLLNYEPRNLGIHSS